MKDSLRKGISFGLTSAIITTLGLMVGLHSGTSSKIVVLLPISTAIIVSLIWGLSILTALSYVIAKSQGEPPCKVVGEHLLIAIVVILLTHWVGDWIGTLKP